MSRPPIIGVSGYARAGKDSAAAALLALSWHHGSFAAKLKAFLYAVNPQIVQNGITYRLANLVDAYGWERCKDDYPEVRALLQRTGTDAGRRVLWEDVWVDAAMRDLPGGRPAVFTDCRFPNEAEAIRRAGGLVIRVNRPGVGPAVDEHGVAHESETALDDYRFDAVIDNDSTLKDLHAKVVRIGVTSWLPASQIERATQA